MPSKSKTGFSKRLIGAWLVIVLIAALSAFAVVPFSAANTALIGAENHIADIAVSETIEASSAVETPAPPAVESSVPGWVIVLIITLVVILLIIVVVLIFVLIDKSKGDGAKHGAPAHDSQISPHAQLHSHLQKSAGSTSSVHSSDGSGETVFHESHIQITGISLMRKSNNETVNINKPEFTIGKERRRVDYCVADNSSVSRVHAKLRVRGGICCISDLGSTNCTYVNGTKLGRNQEVALKKGDKIKLSYEEFEML